MINLPSATVSSAGCGVFALCNGTEFGCCPGNDTKATGPHFEGCDVTCEHTEFGCCDEDGKTAKTDEAGTGCPVATNATMTEDEAVTQEGEAVSGGRSAHRS